jgi:uncharacterized repeat protein (TIGR01451 family)
MISRLYFLRMAASATRTLICIIALTIPAGLMAQQPFTCVNQFFLTLSTEPPSLNEVKIDPQTGNAIFQTINGNIQIAVNAAGYRSVDNFIYSIDPDNRTLVRIDAFGNATVLATLPLKANVAYFAGDISPDGKYLVLLGTLSFGNGASVAADIARVDLEDPFYGTTSQTINVTAQIFDIAFHPVTDVLYGYDSFSQRLIRIDPFSGAITFPFPPNTAPVVTGSLFFDAYGNLYAYGSPTSFSDQNSLYLINSLTGRATFLTTGAPAQSSDGCSCPYTIELSKSVLPKEALPCTEVEYTFQIVNSSRNQQQGIRLEDRLPPGFTFVRVSANPIGGDLATQPGDVIFRLNNLTVPRGTHEIKIIVNTGNVPAGTYKNQARLLNLPAALGSTRKSDDLSTLVKGDSTALKIIRFPFDTVYLDRALCAGASSVTLDAQQYASAVSGQVSFLWPDNSTLPSLTVQSPGKYTSVLSAGCDSAWVVFNVMESAVQVAVEQDQFKINLGDSLIMEAYATNTGIQTNYIWKDPQPGSVRCPDCPVTIARPFNDILYTIIATNELGCSDSTTVRVQVDKNVRVYFPNVFMPDISDDYRNGYFYPTADPYTMIESLQVFSRWGEKLYEVRNLRPNDPYSGWDGTQRGQPVMPGVFVWVARIVFLDGQEFTLKGDVTVVR